VEEKVKQALHNAFRPTLILSWLICVMIFLYPAAVGFILIRFESFAGFAPLTPVSFNLLQLFCLVLVGVVFTVCKRWHNSLLELPNRKLQGEQEMTWVFEHFVLRSLFIMALSELGAILGFLLFLLQATGPSFIFFFLLTLAQMVYFFPRYQNWERVVLYHLKMYVEEQVANTH